jgi:uncharacterized membrane protein
MVQDMARRRIELGLLVGLLCAGALAAFVPWEATVLLGWDAGLAVFGVAVWAAILPLSPEQTGEHARQEIPSLKAADSIIIGAAIACLAAVSLILIKAANSAGGMKAFLIAVGVLSVIFSWAAVHTVFTLRYARLFYGDPEGGVDFKEKEPPDYGDFAYLSFTIGMTFQVSDTDLNAKPMRRAALGHALIAYLFGVVIVGLVINVVASLLH